MFRMPSVILCLVLILKLEALNRHPLTAIWTATVSTNLCWLGEIPNYCLYDWNIICVVLRQILPVFTFLRFPFRL